jgi:hypothetical protein
MSDKTNKSSKPNDPPYGGGEDERPEGEERPDPAQEVKEPPKTTSAGAKKELPRKGDV